MTDSDYSPPPGTIAGGYVWKPDASGNLGLYYNGTEIDIFSDVGALVVAAGRSPTTGGSWGVLQYVLLDYGGSQNYDTGVNQHLMYFDGEGTFWIDNSPSGQVRIQNFLSLGAGIGLSGTISAYGPNSIPTVQGGVPAEYASTGPAGQVSLGTGSTAILSYTPTANALFLVVANFTHKSATVAGTATLTYEDVGLSATATQSYTIASAASGVSVSQSFLCCAVSGTAIALVGTSATANDILASAAIFQL